MMLSAGSAKTILLVGEKLFAKLQKKPDKKTEVKRSIMADMRKLGNLYLEFSQQNPQTLGSAATSLDMLERRNFPTLEKAITTYTTRDDTDLKAGLKASLYYLLKTMANIVKGTFIVNHEDDKATEIKKFVVVLELNHASVFGDDAKFEHDGEDGDGSDNSSLLLFSDDSDYISDSSNRN